jgi:hypothetical protein
MTDSKADKPMVDSKVKVDKPMVDSKVDKPTIDLKVNHWHINWL